MRRRVWLAVTVLAAIGVLVTSGCAKSDPSPKALVIGDSLTVGAQIGGLGKDGSVTVDAREGRTTDAAVAVAESVDLDDYPQVIVAVGTNDYHDSTEQYATKIDRMMQALGSDKPVTWVNVDAGTAKLAPAADGVNAALAAAAKEFPNLTIADWNAYINGRDDRDQLRAGDEVHDSAAGYRVRATWMRDLVGS